MSKPRGRFGVHSLCFYNRETYVPIAILKVIGECNFNFEAEWAKLEGGSSNQAWDAAVSRIESSISFTGKEFDPATMALLMGGQLIEGAGEPTGAADAFLNRNGTSVVHATTGIAAVNITDASNLKEGKYVIKAVTANTAELYCLSDVDFKTGNNVSYIDDNQKVADLDFSSGDAALADFGITLQKGTGAVAFTVGDTASFTIRKPNKSYAEVIFGQSSSNFPEVGVLIAGERQSDGTIEIMDLPFCKAAGMPVPFTPKEWAEWNVTIEALYDQEADRLGSYRRTIAA